MTKPKIAVLTFQVISERNYKRLGIDTIQKNSELIIVDFTFYYNLLLSMNN